MDRRNFIKISLFTGIILVGCKNKGTQTESESEIKHYLESDIGKEITLEGKIIHVCPIEGLMMKLKLADGEIIKVVHPAKEQFEKTWNEQTVKIQGELQRTKISRKTIEENHKEQKLLCHIDHSPCLDKKWVENRWKDGSAERMLKRDYDKLQTRMREYKANHVDVFTLTAKDIQII